MVTLQLDALEVPEIELTETICEGDNYQIGDSTYTESGGYLHILSADNGCDSIVQLDLTVLDTFQRSFAAVSCSGDSYIWNNITYDQAGTYQQILESENGCDSTVTLNLAMINALQTNLDESICAGTAYQVDTSFYTESGVYIDTLISSDGCDSIVHLQLMVQENLEGSESATFCEGEIHYWNGTPYTEEGTYVDTLQGPAGCDSIVTLYLSELTAVSFSFADAFCENRTYEWNGVNYSTPGIYQQTFVGSNGCDSVVILELGAIPLETMEIDTTLCEGEFVEINDVLYDQDAVFTIPGEDGEDCDTEVILTVDLTPVVRISLDTIIPANTTITLGGQTFSETNRNGEVIFPKAAANGCDSIVTVRLTFEERKEVVFIPENGQNFEIPDDIRDPNDLPADKTVEFSIFNRWRKEVYNEIIPDEAYPRTGWRGNSGLEDLPAGTYFLMVKFSDGVVEALTVTILR